LLKFIGRGSYSNKKELNTSAFCKFNDNEMLLIDCGGTIFHRILNLELLDDVKILYIAITHLHPDHVGSLGDLIFYCHYEKNISVHLYDFNDHYTECLRNVLRENLVPDNLYTIDKNCPIIYSSVKLKHNDLTDTNAIILKKDNSFVFYTGDTCDIEQVLKVYKSYHFSRVYIDCCFLEYPNNPHMSLDTLIKNIPLESRRCFWCMHFDCDNAISKAMENGFNIVETE
jgi:ribonuclease BN (tRNA processing enzyme)